MGPEIPEVQAELYMMDLQMMQAQKRHNQQEQPSEGISKLDLKAPAAARKEYEKGRLALLHKDFGGSVAHLTRAATIYPQFVAAHNSLGSAYMELGSVDKAREEFERASLLDEHLPNSFSNLCHADLALKQYAAAEQAIKKASELAPLDINLLPTLVYAQVMNHDYKDAIATAHKVHAGKHESAAMVHFFAAAAWREQNNLPEMEAELKLFLAEDPKNPSAEKARQLIAQIDDIRLHPPSVKVIPLAAQPSEEMIAAQREEQQQIAEAEKLCVGCGERGADASVYDPSQPRGSTSPDRPQTEQVRRGSSGWVLHKSVDEVALLFAATDHGKAVSDLAQQDVGLKDNHEPPSAIIGFRNESELPLRLGLLIDTSASITGRFNFEQRAAASFLQKVLVNRADLAFVVGFSNSVLMVQDFTSDQSQLARAVNQLAPGGGTALWDAVAFASEKLAGRAESQPVAKILVVISDGRDNSSKATLKQAIKAAESAEITVYTVSTEDGDDAEYDAVAHDFTTSVGNTAMKVLAEQSGGSAFVPGSLAALKKSLGELQEVIRSRYLISYRPARFRPDGRYRSIDIGVQKSGHKLRVYARKGYYARMEAIENAQASTIKTP